MNGESLKRDLLKKMIIAKIDIAAYLLMRKAKGYMSVIETGHLRDNLFDLSAEYREMASRLNSHLAAPEMASINQGIGAVSSAAVCLMTGCHDCPQYIAIDAEKLENCLRQLSASLKDIMSHQLAVES
ncbi:MULTISPECIES: biofilm formation regulator BssR [Buttiauxella]|jgi:biofilm regulator BssR|uniref:BssR family biofilm regulator n=1 Tax=Buttiauxella ferragutiae ATCC 51602 TaxID=1354252 RepID=A0ABX2W855_9ENTR|nr:MULTISPECIES: biofilm formation regulator BssR [Buttiauxella]AYN29647.1 transcriptional regulator [Buttiauxella sp. 3AFRM03]MCE0826603.1 biofilm formation regulator BssR [Buttiauxella ferragutiae]OAT27324.1 BssR family biofilm regulator [Buttiauxella ferragutiae ATCC 51602]UNK62775.1 biofilm formation regulator BssR [Buttiauxella ferragutiae]